MLQVLTLLTKRVLQCLAYALCFIPGILLALPFFLVASIYSKQKAREAVAKSTVKLKGRDVLATWKILVGTIFVPCLHLFYTICAYFLLGQAAAVVYFFFMPFVSAMSIFAFENFRRVFSSLKPLFLLLNNKEGSEALRGMRDQCKEEVRQIADILEWVPEDYEGPDLSPTGAVGSPQSPHAKFQLSRSSNDNLQMPKQVSRSWLSGPSYDWWADPDY